MVATGAFTGPAIESLDKIAHLANRQPQPFSATKESSLEAWGAGKFEQAAAEDPGFSAAWLGWLRALALKRNSAEGSRVAERALAAPLRSPIDKAEIEALAATIQTTSSGAGQSHGEFWRAVSRSTLSSGGPWRMSR